MMLIRLIKFLWQLAAVDSIHVFPIGLQSNVFINTANLQVILDLFDSSVKEAHKH